MKKLILLFSSFLFILSCEKNGEIECYLPAFQVESNSPVVSGNDIMLSSSTTTANLNNAEFYWTGPNGFVSNEQNPILQNSTLNMAGEYSLIVKKGICESEVAKVNVEIIANTITCNPSDNTGTFTDQFYSISYYSINTGVDNGKFYLHAGASNNSLNITFHNNDYPTVGMYSIKPNGSVLNSNEVQVLNRRGDVFNPLNYYAKNGDVLISKTNSGKYYAIFCNVAFYFSTNTSPSNNGTVKIIEQ